MKHLHELVAFLLGFIPWILFLFISGHSLASLERAIVICLTASVLFGFRDLRRGFLLAWGSLLFFAACAILVNGYQNVFLAKNMSIIANGFLASLIWLTILLGKPFTLQYAKTSAPKERWTDPRFVKSCRFIAIVWGLLMTFSTAVSLFRTMKPGTYPEGVYMAISIGIILGGTLFTHFYKLSKRSAEQ